MIQTFKPTEIHNLLLEQTNHETKDAIKYLIEGVGYYHTIQILTTQCGKTEDEAKALADIGCYIMAHEDAKNESELNALESETYEG